MKRIFIPALMFSLLLAVMAGCGDNKTKNKILGGSSAGSGKSVLTIKGAGR